MNCRIINSVYQTACVVEYPTVCGCLVVIADSYMAQILNQIETQNTDTFIRWLKKVELALVRSQ